MITHRQESSPASRILQSKEILQEKQLVQGFDFEVFGKVQRVFFRKYTHMEATRLGLRGVCRNTPNRTVSGTVAGPAQAVASFREWLESVGSPKSRIDKLVVSNERFSEESAFEEVNKYNGFEIDTSYGHAPRRKIPSGRP
jgi:acylphosphatase